MDVPLVVLRRVDYTNSCFVWVVEANVPMVMGVDPGTSVGTLGIEAHGQLEGTCANVWRLTARPSLARDVIDRMAVPGQIPPVIASRALNGECFASARGGCEDYYAAELHRE